jgi:hypothetical protein
LNPGHAYPVRHDQTNGTAVIGEQRSPTISKAISTSRGVVLVAGSVPRSGIGLQVRGLEGSAGLCTGPASAQGRWVPTTSGFPTAVSSPRPRQRSLRECRLLRPWRLCPPSPQQRLGLGASDFCCLNVISIAGTATEGVIRTACAGRTVTACFGPTVVRPSRTGAVLGGPVLMIQSSWPR